MPRRSPIPRCWPWSPWRPGLRDGAEGFRFAVHPADGTVLHKGRPVPKAFVRFHPTDPATVKIPDGRKGLPVMLTTETERTASSPSAPTSPTTASRPATTP